MPENEFEKQVKELMEGLHFSPSEPVWEKIKKGITEKKRRIWPVIFLFIAIAFLGGYWLYNDATHTTQTGGNNYKEANKIKTKSAASNHKQEGNNDEQNINKQNETVTKNNAEENKPVIAASNTIKAGENIAANSSSKKEKHSKIVTAKNANIHLRSSSTNDLKNNTAVEKENVQVHSQSSISSNATENNSSIPNQNKEITTAPVVQNPVAVTQSQPTNSTDKTDVSNQQQTDSINNNKSESNTVTPAQANAVATQLNDTKIKQSKNHKWLFGVSAMYGSSNITSNLVNISNEKSQSATVSGPISNNPSVEKSPYQTQPAYNFGITVQRKILKNSYIASGLSFVHLSSKSYTALKFDSSLLLIAPAAYASFNAASNLYRAGSEKTYINKFNFIELPLSFQSSIFHTKNFGLLYNAGFSFMRLLSSKALIYDKETGSYFTNDDLLRRTQFLLNGGLNFEINTNHAGMFLVGPQLKYSLSADVKNKDYNHFHFINYGVQASWLFHKK